MRKAMQGAVAALAILGAVAVAAPAGKAAAGKAPSGAGAATAPAVEVPVIEHAGYTFCANEANDAMALGRMVMVFNRSRDQVSNDPSLPPYIRGMAADFFRAVDAGEVPTYAHFATTRFLQCLQTQRVPAEVPEGRAFACLTRVDIPYFYSVLRRGGEPREAAVAKLQQALAGWQYPEGLIQVLAEPSYRALKGDEVRQLQVFLLSSCLLPPEQVAHYYGAPPATEAAPAPATPAPSTAPGAARGGKSGGKAP